MIGCVVPLVMLIGGVWIICAATNANPLLVAAILVVLGMFGKAGSKSK